MEGPLFLQSQRFGTKVARGRGRRAPADLGGGCGARGGRQRVGARGGSCRPRDVPAELISHPGEASAGLGVPPPPVLGGRSGFLLGKLRPGGEAADLQSACAGLSCPVGAGPPVLARSLASVSRSLFPEVEEDLGCALSCQSPRRGAPRVF